MTKKSSSRWNKIGKGRVHESMTRASKKTKDGLISDTPSTMVYEIHIVLIMHFEEDVIVSGNLELS